MFSTGILSPIDWYSTKVLQLHNERQASRFFFCESVDKLFRSDVNVVVNMKKGYTEGGTGVSPPKKIFEILERLFVHFLVFFFFFFFLVLVGGGGGGETPLPPPPPPWIRHCGSDVTLVYIYIPHLEQN